MSLFARSLEVLLQMTKILFAALMSARKDEVDTVLNELKRILD